MNGGINVGKVVDIVFHSGQLLRVGEKPFHLGLRAAVAELEVVEHGVVLLRKPLICIRYSLHRRAHLVGVVGNVCNCHIRRDGRSLRPGCRSVKALLQRSGKAGDGLHVGIGAESGCGVSVGGVLQHGILGGLVRLPFAGSIRHGFSYAGGVLPQALPAGTEQRLDAADELLIVCVGVDALPDDAAEGLQ